MATTAKIAKDRKQAEANKLAHEQKKKPKFACRHRNRCWRCGRPRGVPAQVRNLPAVLPATGAEWGNSRRGEGELVMTLGREVRDK